MAKNMALNLFCVEPIYDDARKTAMYPTEIAKIK